MSWVVRPIVRDARRTFVGVCVGVTVALALLAWTPGAQAGGLPYPGASVPLESIEGAVIGRAPTIVLDGTGSELAIARVLDGLRDSGAGMVYILNATPDKVTAALGESACGVASFTPNSSTQLVISYVDYCSSSPRVGFLAVVGDDSGKSVRGASAGQIVASMNELTRSLDTAEAAPEIISNLAPGGTDDSAFRSGGSAALSAQAYGDSPTGGHYNSIGFSSRQIVLFQNFSEPGWTDGKLDLSNYAYIVHYDGFDDRDFWVTSWYQRLTPGDALSGNSVRTMYLQPRYKRVYWDGPVDRSINTASPGNCPDAEWGSAHVVVGWPIVETGNIDYYYSYNGTINNYSSLPTYAQWKNQFRPNSDRSANESLTQPGFNEVVPQNQKFAVDIYGDVQFLRVGAWGLRTYNLPSWRFTWTKPAYLP